MKKFSGVIFDCDGVIFPNRFKGVFGKVFSDFSISEDLKNKVTNSRKAAEIKRKTCIGKYTLKEELEIFDKMLGIPKGTLEKYLDEIDSKLEENKDVIKLSNKLRKLSIKTAILTDNTDKFNTFFVPKFHLDQHFDFLFNSWDLGMTKDGLEKIYDFVARKMKMEPAECIYVDDKEENVRIAEASGMTGIIYKFPVDNFLELENKIISLLNLNGIYEKS